MANSSYTFAQVVGGTGFFSKSQDTGYSAGVRDLQTYLRNIGYTISDANGRFQNGTEVAVKGFQTELGITSDGSAGPATCLRLNTVRSSSYFTSYGKPLENSQWGRANILAGNFADIDLLARIILAESGYQNQSDQAGVAIVIKNRCNNGGGLYVVSLVDAPNASIYARVIGKKDQYDTAKAGNSIAQKPQRGYYGTQSQGFIDPGWKNAVELAKKIANNTTITTTGKKVSGTTILSSEMTVNSVSYGQYLNQLGWDSYAGYYASGDIDENVQPITFASSATANIICKVR